MSSDSRPPSTRDHELAQQALSEWRHIFDAVGHLTILLDPEYRIVAANRAVQRAAGKSEKELIGRRCYEVFHNRDATGPVPGCPMEEMLRSGRLEPVDMEMEAFGGWYLVSCAPVLDEAGGVERIIHSATDITARKRTEESLRQGGARYRELVDHMSSGVAVYEAVDDGGDFVFREFNLGGQRIEQTDKADVIGRRVTEVFPGVAEFGLLEVFQRVWRTGTPEHFPVALYKDERIAGWRDNFVYKLPSGEIVAVYDDVTARKQAEERLEHLNSVLRALRNVSQLITRETDRERLLRGVCDSLVETRGYHAAWAVLVDESGRVGLASASGGDEGFGALVERARGGALPACIGETLAEPGVRVFPAPHRECDGCPMSAVWSASSVLSSRLEHGQRVYGTLAVCMPHDYAVDAEEQSLFSEVAEDVAYALRQIELGEQRRRTEQALRESEERYRALFETMAEGVVYQDVSGGIISANPAAERILGISLVDMLGRTSSDERWVAIREDGSPFAGDDHPSMVALRTGQPVRNVVMGIHNPATNARRWILINAVPEFRSGETAPYRVYTTFVDVTELREAESALGESEAMYRALVEQSLQGIVVVQGDPPRFVFANRAAAEAYGVTVGELLAFPPGVEALALHPDDREAVVRRYLARLADKPAEARFEARIVRSDGTVRWLDMSASRIEHRGAPASQVTFVDITERKQAEEALRESRAFLESVIEQSPYAMWISDSEGNLIRMNQALRNMFHVTDEDLVGKYNVLRDNIVEEQGAMPLVRKVFEEGVTARFMLEYDSAQLRGINIRKPESVILDVTVSAIRGPGGRVANAIIQHIDITDRVRAEQTLARQAEELARSNAELQQFAYVASHDLQEPLRKVTSYLQLLEERYRGRLDAGADEFIGFAVDGAQRMKRLISDLLEYSRVGTRGRAFGQTDMNALLEGVRADLQVAIEENRALITADALPSVMADGVQLSQVFQNLITNALKFRRDEPPRVHVSAVQQGEDWVFSVRDNGLGLDPAFKDRIFAMFQRLHGRGKYPGTGIGLALCKKIVERHGGRIWVESEPERGSTFYFTLPAIRGERS